MNISLVKNQHVVSFPGDQEEGGEGKEFYSWCTDSKVYSFETCTRTCTQNDSSGVTRNIYSGFCAPVPKKRG